MNFLIIYLLIINAIGVLFMQRDKQLARHRKQRIPEATLMTIAVIGGSAGCITGMLLFHHKTRHLKFTVGLPLLLVMNLLVIYFLLPILQ